jgi:hypothetical protein
MYLEQKCILNIFYNFYSSLLIIKIFPCQVLMGYIASWLSRWHQINRYFLNGTCCLVFLSLFVRNCFVCPFACHYINIGLWVVELSN